MLPYNTYHDVLKVITTSNELHTRLEAVKELQNFFCLDRKETIDTLISLVRNQEIEVCREFIALIIRPNLLNFNTVNIHKEKDALLKASVNYIIALMSSFPNEEKLLSEKPLFIENSKEMLDILNDLFLITPKKSTGFPATLTQLSQCKHEELMEMYMSYIIKQPDYKEQDIVEKNENLLYMFNKIKAIELSDRIDNQLSNNQFKEKKVKI